MLGTSFLLWQRSAAQLCSGCTHVLCPKRANEEQMGLHECPQAWVAGAASRRRLQSRSSRQQSCPFGTCPVRNYRVEAWRLPHGLKKPEACGAFLDSLRSPLQVMQPLLAAQGPLLLQLFQLWGLLVALRPVQGTKRDGNEGVDVKMLWVEEPSATC